jgi:hypothetical protein
MKQTWKSDTLDRPDIDPLIWIEAHRDEVQAKYPTFKEFFEYIHSASQSVVNNLPPQEIDLPLADEWDKGRREDGLLEDDPLIELYETRRKINEKYPTPKKFFEMLKNSRQQRTNQ